MESFGHPPITAGQGPLAYQPDRSNASEASIPNPALGSDCSSASSARRADPCAPRSFWPSR